MTVTGTGVATGPAGSEGSTAGGSSMITCALVPLTPNEETPTRRGRSVSRGQSWSSVSSRTSPADQSMLLDGASTCRVRGSTPCRSAMMTLTMLATPAAAWVWPMLDFTEPSQSGRSSGRPRP
ncbi:hypothetical protein KCMC57_up16680 [Kitasatospora sp. CMC57]